MKGSRRELEIAPLAPCRAHDQSGASASGTPLNVVEIFLENLHCDTEVVAKIVEFPLADSEQLDDFLATRLLTAHAADLDGLPIKVRAFKRLPVVLLR